jgi:hypothetical protein
MATHSGKGKIIYLLSLMAMVFVILCYFSIQQLKKSDTIRLTDEIIEGIHSASLGIFIADVDFFGYELNNSEFYRTKNSPYLKQHDSIMVEIRNLVKQATEIENISIDADLHRIRLIAERYDSVFRKVSEKIIIKGFKDYGLEGRMRGYAHEIENQKLLTDGELLMLRRDEKDFLLRAENGYIEKFDNLVDRLNSKYAGKKQALELLKEYSQSFHELAKTSDEIGLETQTGLKGELNKQTKILLTALTILDNKADDETANSYNRGITLISVAVIGSAIFYFVLIILIARKL